MSTHVLYRVAALRLAHFFYGGNSGWHWLIHAVSITLCVVLIVWYRWQRNRDIALQQQQAEHNRALLHRAFHDSNTGLPNRAALESHIDGFMHAGLPITCLYIAVDGVRSVSERLGSTGGDALLRSIVQRLQADKTHTDFLGRFNGEAFLSVVTRPHNQADLACTAERILHTMRAPHILKDRTLTTHISIGIASYPTDSADRELLLTAAERAMHAAKQAGGNNVRFASDLHEPIDERNRHLAAKLEDALLTNKLSLVYQPIFTHNERMIAVETLARWHDAEEGFISPAEFVPIAESTGLIVPLSNWVLFQACEQMVAWLQLSTTLDRVCVNVSVKQISRNDFVTTVERTLQATGLIAKHLELEVTESALAGDFNTVKQHLQSLRSLGVRISIDDFGTGYSSLHRVRELDADVLKVDRSFVQGASETPNGIALVQTIVDMAHKLNLSVIAEGVETAEQAAMLRRMGCDELQGYLLARPQSPEILSAALRAADARSTPTSPMRLVPRVA